MVFYLTKRPFISIHKIIYYLSTVLNLPYFCYNLKIEVILHILLLTFTNMSYKISDRNFILNHGKQYKILAVRDLPDNEKPREKLLQYGVGALSSAELLAIVLGVGTKKKKFSLWLIVSCVNMEKKELLISVIQLLLKRSENSER